MVSNRCLALSVTSIVIFTLSAFGAPQGIEKGKDSGYIFSDPQIVKKTKTFKNGTILEAYHQKGKIVSENPQSPWHDAAYFVQGTTVKDRDGKVVLEVGLCETTDPDGDLTWSILWNPADKTGEYQIILGTGKWEKISGKGKILDVKRTRKDEHSMPKWQMEWKLDPNKKRVNAFPKDKTYAYSDESLSFHGPHKVDWEKTLANGVRLVVSSQSGVLLSQKSPDIISPRNYATCYDRGTTVFKNGEALGDIMLLEDTDSDGDVAWLYHIWLYAEGFGTYDFVGGTGKWQGITGKGLTRGMLKDRTDDFYLLKSELRWNIEK